MAVLRHPGGSYLQVVPAELQPDVSQDPLDILASFAQAAQVVDRQLEHPDAHLDTDRHRGGSDEGDGSRIVHTAAHQTTALHSCPPLKPPDTPVYTWMY